MSEATTEAKPVAQVKNPVKEPEWKNCSCVIRTTTDRRFRQFVKAQGFLMKDVLDAALLDYMDNFDANPNGGPVEVEENNEEPEELEVDSEFLV